MVREGQINPAAMDIEHLAQMLRTLRLSGLIESHESLALTAEKQGWGFSRYFYELIQTEFEDRKQRRYKRFLKESKLPREKTLTTFNLSNVTSKIKKQIPTLCEGSFLDNSNNLLLFGQPGRGKTHLACAIGHEWLQRGYRVLFVSAAILVQQLLAAKRDLRLEQTLRKLDRFDAIIVDDFGYIQQSEEEMQVLFIFFSERYERRSLVLTSNLTFSGWEKIFKDPMTTQAAIARLVHHAEVLVMIGTSYRQQQAKQRTGRQT